MSEAMEAMEATEQEYDGGYEEAPQEEAVSSDFELEIVDDTPEQDRVPRRAADAKPNIPDDNEVENYSEGVQKRIKQLKYEYHEERRAKEEAARLREEAVNYAQKVYEENQKLRATLKDGEGVLVEQAKGRAVAELNQAKREYKEAYESGDPDKLLDAQEKLNRAQAQQMQIEQYRPTYSQSVAETPAYQSQPQRVQQQEQVRVQKPDNKALAWAEENKWFNNDDEMTGYALGVHQSLVKEGINGNNNPDEYYRRIDASMRKRFPDKFDDGFTEEAPHRQAGSVVAPASRSAKKPRKVQLTSTQVSLAKRLGITPEQYAAQLLKKEI
jgi:hypothetical protein